MAKKELLSLLGLMLLFGFTTKAEERFEFTKEDTEFAQDLANSSRQISMSAIKEEWLKLQEMQRNQTDQSETGLDLLTSNQRQEGAGVKIFVSSSMGKSLLKTYLMQAKTYKATIRLSFVL